MRGLRPLRLAPLLFLVAAWCPAAEAGPGDEACAAPDRGPGARGCTSFIQGGVFKARAPGPESDQGPPEDWRHPGTIEGSADAKFVVGGFGSAPALSKGAHHAAKEAFLVFQSGAALHWTSFLQNFHAGAAHLRREVANLQQKVHEQRRVFLTSIRDVMLVTAVLLIAIMLIVSAVIGTGTGQDAFRRWGERLREQRVPMGSPLMGSRDRVPASSLSAASRALPRRATGDKGTTPALASPAPVPRDPSSQSGADVTFGRSPLVAGRTPEELCPHLCVPEGFDCPLIVPKLRPGHIQVTDTRGSIVLLADFIPDAAGIAGRLAMFNEDGTSVLCYCQVIPEALRGGDAANSILIHHHDDRAYGKLCPAREANGSYILTTGGGARVHFARDQSALPDKVEVTDESRRQMASIGPLHGQELEGFRARAPDEDPSAHRFVALSSLVDAGLITMALLSIDWLETINSPAGVRA